MDVSGELARTLLELAPDATVVVVLLSLALLLPLSSRPVTTEMNAMIRISTRNADPKRMIAVRRF